MDCSTLGFPVHQKLLELVQTHVHHVSDAIIHRPLLLPSTFPSIRVFFNESVIHVMSLPYWSFSFSISLSNEHSGLISFRMDWFDLLVIQGNLKSLLKHHSSKAPILWLSAYFMVQLSHQYMATGETIALTGRTIFCCKVVSLLSNMLSRLVMAFLPRNKRRLLLCLQSSVAVILEPIPPP